MASLNEKLNNVNNAVEEVHTIYEKLVGEKNNDAILKNKLTSNSKTAIWRLWIYVFAFVSWVQEKFWEQIKIEIQEIADKAQPGNNLWLEEQIKLFQNGDTLKYLKDRNPKYYYESIDPDKQIIKRVSLVRVGNVTKVKVATEDDEGELSKLTTQQLVNFQAFLNQVQFAGTSLNASSLDADILHTDLTIYFDNKSPEEEVTKAYQQYLIELNGLNFNGTFYTSELIKRLKMVNNVIDVGINIVEAKSAIGEFVQINRKYEPVSGYLKIDPQSLITYVVE